MIDPQDRAFIVVCLDGGRYYIATRRTFRRREDAEKYAATVNPSRVPLVVEGRFGSLRFPDFEYEIPEDYPEL